MYNNGNKKKKGLIAMRLVDITNSFPNLVQQQLAHTNAKLVQVYSLGQTTVIFTESPHHQEVVLRNERRNIQNAEIEYVLSQLTKRKPEDAELIRAPHVATATLRSAVAS
ncbi:DUF1827 family protein [Lacticaseibacillus pantheris]|uniref:DUF1827 family protein n=1 Tax=Lacticaseibacillus pantheris DSM 15945 = JCM 12539 = NBRC 106106 TaxID=1423783 RepID=A0A0R1TWB6_9LACO|nr:DUF1827 family protein [Lacticaseibacillus pantheris]KRL85625.1 hypothetical protein FC50_GL001800 [Lacticaseibacillus pantheris DSM 15945 = JCM 12539 = NBRC 106106]WKF84700.1 DUF1827 family protein [Lacticaseibacillus pantheris]